MKKSYNYLLVLTLLLSGCDLFNKESESVSENISDELTFDTTKNVSITFYHTMNQYLKEILDAAITRFNKVYPNITVENVSAGGYDDVCDQLATSISAGNTLCDMAYCYPDHVAKYNKANSVIALDKYINNETYGLTSAQVNDFVEAYWNEGKAFGDGLMYSLPLSKSTEVMFYDKTFFKNNDLSVPTHWFKNDTGLDEKTSMEYVCEQIKEIDPNSIPLGYDSDSNWFITLAEQYGSTYTSATGSHFLFNTETNRKFVSNIKNMYDNGLVTTKSVYGQYTSNLFKNQDTKSSRCYMCIGSSAGASNQVPAEEAFEVGAAKIPQFNQNNGKVISQGPNVCIFKNSDKQVQMACWLLLRFLTTDISFQAGFSMQSGYTPVIKSVYKNDVYQDWIDSADGYENITALSNAVARGQADWYYTSPAFIGSSEARVEVGKLLTSILLNNTQSIEEAFETTIDQLNHEFN